MQYFSFKTEIWDVGLRAVITQKSNKQCRQCSEFKLTGKRIKPVSRFNLASLKNVWYA